LVSEFFVHNKWEIALQVSVDDDGLRAYVYTMLNNARIDKWRKTERGRLRRRVDKLLRDGDFIESPKGFWRRVGDTNAPYAGPDLPLEQVLWSINVPLVAWRQNAERIGPHADGRSFLEMLKAIFEVCQGAIHVDRIVGLIANKVGLQSVSYAELIDMVDPSLGPEDIAIAAEDDEEIQKFGGEIWAQLAPLERRVIPMLDESARAVAEALGIGKTKANQTQQRAKEKLRVLLFDSSDSLRDAALQYLVNKSEYADN
jgi:DNA-directed RNA polymerase specialized sigma24 family protein